MTELPFQISIKCNPPENKEESLTCTALLRAVPGRREVYEATWNNKSVIVKLFPHKTNAKRHLKREWQGLSQLKQRQLSAPEPLFTGKTNNNQWVMVSEKITDSSTLLDVFYKTVDAADRLDLLIQVCRELAEQHSKGVLQKDLHLGNFLLAGGRVFALDVGQMKFYRRPITKEKGISQLALLARYIPDDNTEDIKRLYDEYAGARGWGFEEADYSLFRKELALHRDKTIGKGLKKSLRTSKRYLRIRAGKAIAVFDRDFCKQADPVDFIEQTDVLMDKGQIIKNGNTCYVSRITYNGRDAVIKRYNHKGFVHSLGRTIKRSRARRGWLYGHRLIMLDIGTPKPLAYIERYKGPLIWQSYIVTEYVEGRNLYSFLRENNTTSQQRSDAAGRLAELLRKMEKHRISHGDLKHSNILITHDGAVLTDLDAMQFHKWLWTYKRKRAKDIKRFSIEWPGENNTLSNKITGQDERRQVCS